MTQYDVASYMPIYNSNNYEDLYSLYKNASGTRILAAFNNHAYIIYGIRKNTEEGTINDGEIYTWEPMDGEEEKFSMNDVVYYHK